MKLTLTQRLSLVFAVLLLVCSGTSAWLQLRSNRMHEQEVVQGLSRDLAESIARDAQLTNADGLMPGAVRNLFSQLMIVNPSVGVYLLEPDGRIAGHAAPEGRLRRDRVDLAPVRRLLDGGVLPILGDNPRSVDGRKVFSAAPLQVNGRDVGFIYVVLLGEAHDLFAARGSANVVLKTAWWSIGLVALLCLAAGLVAFNLIIRPLRRLTEAVRQFDIHGVPPELPPVHADLGMIERVLSNLLDNALRYTPEGGHIEIALAASDDSLDVTIGDTGPGIPQELREGLFQRPFTVGGARRDGGLGLRIVHRILELHGREIILLETSGQGARFGFSLPVFRKVAAGPG